MVSSMNTESLKFLNGQSSSLKFKKMSICMLMLYGFNLH